MDPKPPRDAARATALFQEHLGTARFWKFTASLRGREGQLLFWQAKILDELEAAHAVTLPRTCGELGALLLPLLPAPRTMTASEVPPWITVDFIEGAYPVQACGSVVPTARWYFRARHEDWSLAVSADPVVDPADVAGPGDLYFFHEEPFGHLQDEAGSMPQDVARFFIVRELTRWRSALLL